MLPFFAGGSLAAVAVAITIGLCYASADRLVALLGQPLHRRPRAIGEGTVLHQRDTQLEARIQAFEMAFRMQTEATDAFNINKESDATKALYGAPSSDMGSKLLVARRLVERGVRFVQVQHGGWDTHHTQAKTMTEQLTALSELVLAMKSGLGTHWGTTLVLAMTEFGRTARENGTAGTDHGTGGLMMAVGGALKGGRVMTDWPGLGEGDLLADRDLMPTRDVRAFAAWALHGMFGVEGAALSGLVFPGLDLGADPGLLL